MHRKDGRGLRSGALALALCGAWLAGVSVGADTPVGTPRAIRVFVLAGDENVLGQGVVTGRTDGVHEDFYPNATPTKGEARKHVNVAVYEGAYSPEADYDALRPVVTGLVEVGEARTRQAEPGKRGRVAVPMAPFPERAGAADHTTVLRGYIEVKVGGTYEFRPGTGESAFNVTTVEGREVYRCGLESGEPVVTPMPLEPGKRHAFRTVFLRQPGHAFRLPLLDRPGTLETVVTTDPRYAFVRTKGGDWVTRDDVTVYDLHPIHNNTRTPGHPLQVGDVAYGGAAMNANTRKVHDAQMAVGDAARHQEFAGNAASIDTAQCWQPPERSPGGLPSCYNGNARTFLETGAAGASP